MRNLNWKYDTAVNQDILFIEISDFEKGTFAYLLDIDKKLDSVATSLAAIAKVAINLNK